MTDKPAEQVKEAAAAALARAQLQEEPEVAEPLPLAARDSGAAAHMRPGVPRSLARRGFQYLAA